MGVSQGGHACAHGLAKQFLCPLSCLTGLTSGVREAELRKPDLGCAARLEPVRELPVCVFQGRGAGASQGAAFLSCGSSTSLALIAVCADERARAPETGQTRALGMAGPNPPFFLMEE